MLYFIYKLVDPRTSITGYVGITADPNQRHQQHITRSDSNSKKNEWIEQLDHEGIIPEMEILEIVGSRKEALEREKYWIQHYFSLNTSLTNIRHIPQNKPVNDDTLYSQDYYTSSQAIAYFIQFGLSESVFRREVGKGTIKKLLPDGKQRGGWYQKSDVHNYIAEEIERQVYVENIYNNTVTEDIIKRRGPKPQTNKWDILEDIKRRGPKPQTNKWDIKDTVHSIVSGYVRRNRRSKQK